MTIVAMGSVGKQAQLKRQIRHHVRRQLAACPTVAHSVIDRIAGYRGHQHPQRHLIRTHNHIISHMASTPGNYSTPRRHTAKRSATK